MLLDCEKLQWKIDDIIKKLGNDELDYNSLMKEMKVAKNIGVKIPHTWNCLEWCDKDKTSLIHYTDMPMQPWVSIKNRLGHLWVKDLIDAIRDGFIDINYVIDHIKKEWVRPSLKYQIENNCYDSLKLPKEAIEMDLNFVAPYKKMV